MFSANLVLDLVAGDFWVALYPFSVTYTNSRLLKTPITTNCESGLFSNGTIGPVFMNLLSSSSFTARSKSTLEYGPMVRSEEHTSELQSHHDLVCRLLLEKKKIILLVQISYLD